MRLLPFLLALALPLAATGCSTEETSATAAVPVDDGGYALVRIEVPGGHDAEVTIAVNDAAPNESYYLLVSDDHAPGHVGWFDVGPWAAKAPSCRANDDDDGDGCNPEGAGRIASVRVAATGSPVALVHRKECSKDSDRVCTLYYAVLAGSRLPATRSGVVTVTTRDVLHAHPAEIAVMQ